MKKMAKMPEMLPNAHNSILNADRRPTARQAERAPETRPNGDCERMTARFETITTAKTALAAIGDAIKLAYALAMVLSPLALMAYVVLGFFDVLIFVSYFLVKLSVVQ